MKDQAQEVEFSPVKTYRVQADRSDRSAMARAVAALSARSDVAAARVIEAAEHNSQFGAMLDVPGLIDLLRQQVSAVQGGNLADAEAILMNQAIALQSVFVRLCERGLTAEKVHVFETNMRLALRAQSQCRATLESLAVIKNPPVIFAKQANVTSGPQQINNAVPRTRKTECAQTQLLEDVSDAHERLDDGAALATGGGHPPMATVGEIDWSKDTERKGTLGDARL